jgi:hypothetical protein
MGEMISLADWRERSDARDAAVQSAVEQLDELQETLISAAMHVACAGVWREWDDSMPEGATVRVGPASFVGCGDPTAELLGLLAGRIQNDITAIEAAETKGQQRG